MYYEKTIISVLLLIDITSFYLTIIFLNSRVKHMFLTDTRESFS